MNMIDPNPPTEAGFSLPGIEVLHGDCREVMAQMAVAGRMVDSIVTDPPAGIAFMGKAWDDNKGGRDNWISWMQSVAFEAIKIAKPGAHALVWALPRTSHWTVMGWENAGWEVRDRVSHIFGTGFPKSHNLTGEWEGWGTALKPAMEDWWLLRKPLIGTVVENVTAYGTGAINIDACRVAHVTVDGGNLATNPHLRGHINGGNGGHIIAHETERRVVMPHAAGRWPPNILHDGSAEVLATFPNIHGAGKARSSAEGSHSRIPNTVYGLGLGAPAMRYGDSGTAARFFPALPISDDDRRFFYAAKASRKERGEGNTHSTVKPLSLMRWLTKLINPPGGTVLDPFAGSGTTGLACQREGFDCVLVEREAEYVEIIRKRLSAATSSSQPSLFT